MRRSGYKQLLETFLALKMAEMLTYKQLEETIGCNPRIEGAHLIKRAIDAARRRGVCILNQRNKGYYRGDIDQRSDWVEGRREHVQRVLTEGYISTVVVESEELNAASNEQKQRLAEEQVRTSLELKFALRLSKSKKLPPPDKTISSSWDVVGDMMASRKKNKSA